jgi:chromosome segregation ATPase
MFGSKNILALQSQIDSLQSELKDLKDSVYKFAHDIGKAHREEREELEESISALKYSYEGVDKWDEMTRAKFRAIEKHFGISINRVFMDGAYEVRENSDQTILATDNQ